jgi:hypothetical protein
MTLEDYIHQWDDSSLRAINIHLNHLERRLYKSFEPSTATRENYWSRLEKWIENVPGEDDKKTLLRLAPEIFYVGPEEFLELYRLTYENIVAHWLIDSLNIDILEPTAQQKIRAAVTETWFCPISDSMRINSFYHVNAVNAKCDLRPDWRSLERFASIATVRDYCVAENIKRIVLLEDFVGGGSQVAPALNFAAQLLPDIQVLFAPLIICPSGVVAVDVVVAAHPGLAFQPALSLPSNAFFTAIESPFDVALTTALRTLIHSTYPSVSAGSPPNTPPYGPYGFPAANPVGGLVVMFSNAPDNTLPLIQFRSSNWEPLFPRHRRI